MPLRPWKLNGDVGQAAGRAPAVGRARRAGGVLHQPQAVLVGDAELVVVGRLAEHVDRQDADRPRRDRGLDRRRVDGPDVRAHVGEDRSAPVYSTACPVAGKV